MQIDITFRNLRARDSIRQRAEALYQKLSVFLIRPLRRSWYSL